MTRLHFRRTWASADAVTIPAGLTLRGLRPDDAPAFGFLLWQGFLGCGEDEWPNEELAKAEAVETMAGSSRAGSTVDRSSRARHDESMPWQFTDDVATFDARARSLLAGDPVTNTIALTVTDWLLAGRTFSDQPPLFAWCASDSGETIGAALMTPPYDLQLAAVPVDTVASLVDGLQKTSVEVPGIRTNSAAGDVFAELWTKNRHLEAVPMLRLRLYGLGTLTTPETQGRSRRATSSDLELVSRWWDAYQHEVDDKLVDTGAVARHAIADQGLLLWLDLDERPVAMASVKPPVAGAARIGPVYTPPENRNRGFGAAVTAASATAAIAAGATHVLLFTDLDNPVSNSIYQRIGFRPIADSRAIQFSRSKNSRRFAGQAGTD